MSTVFLPFFVVLFFSLVASFVASRRRSDFFLANRSIRWPMLVGTFVGTHIGGGFLIGNTDAVAKMGLSGAVYSVGLALGMMFLGIGWGPRLRSLLIGTLPELLGKKFSSVPLKKVGALLAICSLSGILMSQAIGLRRFLSSVGCHEMLFFVSWGAVVLYTALGGLLAVVWTDLLQASIMVVMLGVIFVMALFPEWTTIAKEAMSSPIEWGRSPLSSIVFPVCYMFVTQDMAQRCFAAKTPKDSTKGCIGAAVIFLLLSIVPVAAGLLGRAWNLECEKGSIFMQVVDRMSSPWLFVVTASTVLLAIISTSSTILLALSSNVVQDLGLPKGGGKAVTFLLGILALLGPYFGDDVIVWIVTSNALSVGALFIPVLVAVWSKKTFLPASAAWGSFFLGLIATIISQTMMEGSIAVVVPFLFSAIGFALGWMFDEQKEPAIA